MFGGDQNSVIIKDYEVMNADCHGSRAFCDVHTRILEAEAGRWGVPGQPELYVQTEAGVGIWLTVGMSTSPLVYINPGFTQSNTHSPVR